jgi:hypothetical protein
MSFKYIINQTKALKLIKSTHIFTRNSGPYCLIFKGLSTSAETVLTFIVFVTEQSAFTATAFVFYAQLY